MPNLSDITMTLYMHDLMKIGTVENSLYDEYDAEAEQILHNIEAGEVNSREDMKECVIFVFSHYFEGVFNPADVTDELVDQLYELM